METATVPELPPALEEVRLAGNPSRELRELIALYNSRFEEACTVVRNFLKRDDFIAGYERWLAANPKSTRVPLIKGLIKQSQAQQKQAQEQQAPMLRAIGDVLRELIHAVEFQRLNSFGVYRYGVLRLSNALKLNGEDIDLWTIEHHDPRTTTTTEEGASSMTTTLIPDTYDVPIRLLSGPRGTLLVETETEIQAKYAEMKDDAHIAYAAQPEKELTDQLSRLDAAMAQEIELFGQLEAARGKEVKTYTFRFRVSAITDHEAAEAEANKVVPRQELTYRRVLAQRTFAETDFPGFTSFLEMRTDVALHILRQVAARVTLMQDVRAFLQVLPGRGQTAMV